MSTRRPRTTPGGWPALLLAGLLASAGAAPLAAQPATAPLDPDVVRRALAGATDADEWSQLEQGAIAAADGPFVLRELRIDEAGALEFRLGGYGLPTLEQTTRPGGATHLRVWLPGARSPLAHGYRLDAPPHPFESVRVDVGADGVEVEALLAPGVVAVLDESAEGVRIRALSAALAPAAAPPPPAAPARAFWAPGGPLQHHLARGLAAFPGPRGAAPLGGIAALALLVFGVLRARGTLRGQDEGRATDARRLADRLAAPVEP